MINFGHETEELEFKKSANEMHDVESIEEICKIIKN